MKVIWRDVFDATKMLGQSWLQIVEFVRQTNYKYILFNGIVYDLENNRICLLKEIT